MTIHYKKGYKYQLDRDFIIPIDLEPYLLVGWRGKLLAVPFIQYSETAKLLKGLAGYAWDGCSGPTKDTDTNMQACCGHDIFAQLQRCEILSRHFRNEVGDKWLKKTALLDGMSRFRAWYYYKGLKNFAGGSTKPKNKRRTYIAGKELW
jgi:hypothetical protein